MTAPASNAEFLSGIFGALPGDARPILCGFAGDPKDSSDKGRKWRGWGWSADHATDAPGLNWFFTLATYSPGSGGTYRRSADAAVALYGVMLDDVGTKAAPRERLAALPPSIMVQTSDGNFQAIYLFASPVTERAIADALLRAIIAAGLCDGGADGPFARYSRMPFGVNGKHSPPQQCALVEWHPERRYTPEAIALGLALPDVAPQAPRAPGSASVDWQSKPPEEQARIIEDLRSALAFLPMDARPEFVDSGQNLKGLGDPGFMLWHEAIIKSKNYDDESPAQWDTFDGTRSDYRAIFPKAEALGWVNPRRRTETDPASVGFGQGITLPPGASLVPLPPATLAAPAGVPFTEVHIADLGHAPADPQLWWCESYLPAGHVTLLAGHGGVGKSLLALMLSVCLAIGAPFMRLQTRRARVLFFSAEDQGSLVRRRLARICRDMRVDPAILADTLQVLDATDGEPALFTEQRSGGTRSGQRTQTYYALERVIDAKQTDVLIVDNSSDVFDADEISRSPVRSFVRAMALLVRRRNGAVLLLAHVDKTISRAGKSAGSESYSGSTAWHNSVRSRLFLTTRSAGVLELRHEKTNVATTGCRAPLLMSWLPDTLPKALGEIAPGEASEAIDVDLRALLTLIAEFYSRGEYASTATNGRPNVPNLLKGEPGYPAHLKPAEVFTLLRDAQRRQLLNCERYTGDDRKERTRWQVAPAGLAMIAANLAPDDLAASAASAGSELLAALAH